MKCSTCAFVVLTFAAHTAKGQSALDDSGQQQITETILGIPDDEQMNEEVFENTLLMLSQPHDINRISSETLRSLGLLTEVQIANLQAYLQRNGAMLSIYELQAVPDFDLATIHKIKQFVTVADPSSKIDMQLLRRVLKEGDSYALFRYERGLQPKAGFRSADPAQRFFGSSDKLTWRMRCSKPGDFSVGITAEKDVGEFMRWLPGQRQYGFDYLSVHAQLQRKGRLENLVVGDYQCQFGQGLMLGGAGMPGKGGETIVTARRVNLGVIPYTSAYEAGGLRGAAATVALSNSISTTVFYSRMHRDGNVGMNESGHAIITSLPTSGLHRNSSERADRQAVREKNLGGVMRFRRGAIDAGFMFNEVGFSKPIEPRASVYNGFHFRGQRQHNAGVFLNYTFQNATFFSELASSFGGGTAHTAGILANISPQLDIAVVHRRFARDYIAFYNSAFGENSTAQNEQGIYAGWSYRLNRRWTASGYLDMFRFPWLRFRAYAPSRGHEWLLRATYQPTRSISLFAQLREETKPRNMASDGSPMYQLEEGRKRNAWLSCTVPVERWLRLKTRVQGSQYTSAGRTSKGIALSQNIQVKSGKLTVDAGYALFDTDDFDNRQYFYENDVWMAFSLPAYAGQGVRSYWVVSYDVTRKITCWLRYAHFRYADRDSISAGVDAIDGNIQRDIKLQLLCRL